MQLRLWIPEVPSAADTQMTLRTGLIKGTHIYRKAYNTGEQMQFLWK